MATAGPLLTMLALLAIAFVAPAEGMDWIVWDGSTQEGPFWVAYKFHYLWGTRAEFEFKSGVPAVDQPYPHTIGIHLYDAADEFLGGTVLTVVEAGQQVRVASQAPGLPPSCSSPSRTTSPEGAVSDGSRTSIRQKPGPSSSWPGGRASTLRATSSALNPGPHCWPQNPAPSPTYSIRRTLKES